MHDLRAARDLSRAAILSHSLSLSRCLDVDSSLANGGVITAIITRDCERREPCSRSLDGIPSMHRTRRECEHDRATMRTRSSRVLDLIWQALIQVFRFAKRRVTRARGRIRLIIANHASPRARLAPTPVIIFIVTSLAGGCQRCGRIRTFIARGGFERGRNSSVMRIERLLTTESSCDAAAARGAGRDVCITRACMSWLVMIADAASSFSRGPPYAQGWLDH